MDSHSADYDIIFAGGGTTACVVAGRLAAADNTLRILASRRQRAQTREDPLHIQPARYLANMWDPSAETLTRHRTNPGVNVKGRALSVSHACCVGGGSSINAMMYNRAPASDYDDWMRLGNPGWGAKDLMPLAKKLETYPAGVVDDTHGPSGPVKVSCRGIPARAKLPEDLNDFTTCDVYGRFPKYIDSKTGRRSDTAHLYVYNQAHNSNLCVVDHARVNRVIFDSDKRAVGIEYQSGGRHGSMLTANASRLIVVSAYCSPAILERLGIGARDSLEKHGITMVSDLPGVGQNYNGEYHHAANAPSLTPNDEMTLDSVARDKSGALETQWLQNGKKLLAANGLDGGIKLRPNTRDLEQLGPLFKAHWEQFFAAALDKPLVLVMLWDALWERYSAADDEAINKFHRAAGESSFSGLMWHTFGTCAMKPRENLGVVDPKFNVFGVKNLKVADLSIAPLNVEANTPSIDPNISERVPICLLFPTLFHDLLAARESVTYILSTRPLPRAPKRPVASIPGPQIDSRKKDEHTPVPSANSGFIHRFIDHELSESRSLETLCKKADLRVKFPALVELDTRIAFLKWLLPFLASYSHATASITTAAISHRIRPTHVSPQTQTMPEDVFLASPRKTPAHRRSAVSLRATNLADTVGDDAAANGRLSLAHELAVAVMPEPSAGSKLLAEEFGIEFDEGAEGIDEPGPGGPQIDVQDADASAGDLSFASSEPGPQLDGSFDDGPPEPPDFGGDPAFGFEFTPDARYTQEGIYDATKPTQDIRSHSHLTAPGQEILRTIDASRKIIKWASPLSLEEPNYVDPPDTYLQAVWSDDASNQNFYFQDLMSQSCTKLNGKEDHTGSLILLPHNNFPLTTTSSNAMDTCGLINTIFSSCFILAIAYVIAVYQGLKWFCKVMRVNVGSVLLLQQEVIEIEARVQKIRPLTDSERTERLERATFLKAFQKTQSKILKNCGLFGPLINFRHGYYFVIRWRDYKLRNILNHQKAGYSNELLTLLDAAMASTTDEEAASAEEK
ncbi:GMC oxidoreductase-domain-containing protein [Mycena latifolia]|nr:GMC oxidoreductase-domain-containing protein [Mycena latifolia]